MHRTTPRPRATAVGRVAALSRSRTNDDPEYIEARQELKVLTLEEHISKTVSSWPPLTQAQRDRVASLLRPGGAA